MRRTVGAVFIGLGIFFAGAALMVRFYAAPQLIHAPSDEYTKLTLTDPNASYLSLTDQKVVQAPLEATVTIKGKKTTSTTAVWDYFDALEDSARGTTLSATSWTMAFDDVSGRLKNCCGSSVQGNKLAAQSGLGVIFPVDGVEKKTYLRYDPVTYKAWPAVYQGEETVSGIRAYKFTERIDPTAIQQEWGVPGAVVGLDPKATYDFDKVYSGVLTLWVDPRTGVIIDEDQTVQTELQELAGGPAKVTAMKADLRFTAASKAEVVKQANDAAMKIGVLKTWGPIGSLVLAIILLLTGGFLALRGDGGRGAHALIGGVPASEKTEAAEAAENA